MFLDTQAQDVSGIQAAAPVVDITRGRSRRVPAYSLDYAEASDEDLVQALSDRDNRALEALFDRYGDLVYSVCLRMVADTQIAEDLSQDVFLRLWRRPDLFDQERGRFSTWLLSVARHRAIDERRSRGRRYRHESPPSLSNEENLLSANDGEDKLARTSDDKIIVRRALATLPAEQRLVVELAYFGGYTQQEIAAGLSQPLGTVKTRMRLGLQKLRNFLIDPRGFGVVSK